MDVANGTFWTAQDVIQAARNYCSALRGNPQNSYTGFRDQLLPIMVGNKYKESEAFGHLKRLAKLKFVLKHRGGKSESKSFQF